MRYCKTIAQSLSDNGETIIQIFSPLVAAGQTNVLFNACSPGYEHVARVSLDAMMIEFLAKIEAQSDHLIVAFTGIQQKLGGVPFEFHKSVGGAGAKVLFVRDQGQRWYQYDKETIDLVACRIQETVATAGTRRLSCIGNSMGGFGALMFGALCAADAILAFAPQTTILPRQTSAIGDHRWLKYQAMIEAYPIPDLNALPSASGRVTIHHGADEVLDAAHADRLTWSHERHIQPGCGHDVARALKEQGELTASISSALFR